MSHFLEHHGIELIVAYYILISVLGTMPPLPSNASYLQRWGFAIAQAICGNMQNMVSAMKAQAIPVSEPKSSETKNP